MHVQRFLGTLHGQELTKAGVGIGLVDVLEPGGDWTSVTCRSVTWATHAMALPIGAVLELSPSNSSERTTCGSPATSTTER